MNVSISGIGWVTSQSFGPAGKLASFELTGGPLPRLRRHDVFREPYQRFGRLDTFSKLGLAALAFAMHDAEVEDVSARREIGIVAATYLGCLETDLQYYDTVIPHNGLLASPNLFAYTLPNCFLGEAAIRFGLTGPGFVINEAGAMSLAAVRMAMEMICWDGCPGALAGFCNPPCPEKMPSESLEIPGALFLFLQSGQVPGAYADLSLDADATIRVGEKMVRTWNDLVSACLQNS